MSDAPTIQTFAPLEGRILGVLLEKSLAAPAYYPMTVAAIVAGCNQKSNRDPEMNLDEEAVWDTLDGLRQRGIVTRLAPGGGARVDRFRHEVQTVWGWDKPQRAVMTELLLRGPQTSGELRTHCNRLYPFEGLETVAAVLDRLMQTTPPLVAPLPRAPGQSAVRYTHLLYPDKERPQTAERESGGTGALAAARTSPDAARDADSAAPRAAPGLDAGQVEALQSELGELYERLAGLQRRVEAIERKIEGL